MRGAEKVRYFYTSYVDIPIPREMQYETDHATIYAYTDAEKTRLEDQANLVGAPIPMVLEDDGKSVFLAVNTTEYAGEDAVYSPPSFGITTDDEEDIEEASV